VVPNRQSGHLRLLESPSKQLHPSLGTAGAPWANVPRRTLILYLTNDADSQIVFSSIARRWENVDLLVTHSSRRARYIAHSLRPDLILLDSHLSDCDAHRLLLVLRRNPRTATTPVIIFSANDGERVRFTRSGAAAWFAEPLNIAEVERTTMGIIELASVR